MNSEDQKVSNQINEAFEPETAYYPEKEKIDIFKSQTDLLNNIFADLNAADIASTDGINIYWSRLQQTYAAYQHQLMELRFDIISQFKDIPEYKDWFRKFVNEKESKKKENPFDKFKMWRITKTDMIVKYKMLMETLAKEITLTSYLLDIFYTASQRLSNIENLRRAIEEKKVSKRDKISTAARVREAFAQDPNNPRILEKIVQDTGADYGYAANIVSEERKKLENQPVAVPTPQI